MSKKSPGADPAPTAHEPSSDSGVGEWLRSLRTERGAPLREVAVEAGIDTALLSKIERGLRLPTGEQAAALAGVYGLPVRELEAARIASQFWRLYADHPAADLAVARIQETSAEYRVKRKPAKNRRQA